MKRAAGASFARPPLSTAPPAPHTDTARRGVGGAASGPTAGTDGWRCPRRRSLLRRGYGGHPLPLSRPTPPRSGSQRPESTGTKPWNTSAKDGAYPQRPADSFRFWLSHQDVEVAKRFSPLCPTSPLSRGLSYVLRDVDKPSRHSHWNTVRVPQRPLTAAGRAREARGSRQRGQGAVSRASPLLLLRAQRKGKQNRT